MLFTVNQRIDVVRGQFKTMAVRDRVRGTSFDAIATENATRIIDVINSGVALTCGDPVRVRIFGSFDVNAIRRTGGRAQEATHALLKPVLIAMQHMDSAIARLKMNWFVRVILRNRLPENGPEGHTEAFHQRFERLTDFTKYGWHKLKSNKRPMPRQIAGPMPARNIRYFFNASMICFP